MRRLGGTRRASGGALARFHGTGEAHGDQASVSLFPRHPAVVNATTIFPKSVVRASHSRRLFPSGEHQAKLGKVVLKGPWAGLPIFTFSLEERASCPTSCHVWRACYGNGMPLARRHRIEDEADRRAIFEALAVLCHEHRHTGLVLRLHVLGDFLDVDYATRWQAALIQHAGLHIFGYTAHKRTSFVGAIVREMNQAMPDRCAIRFSHESKGGWEEPMGATTHWGDSLPPPGIPCPQQTEKTLTCGTCGACWSEATRDRTIVFRGHGNPHVGGWRDRRK